MTEFSPRRELAERLAAVIREHRLTNPFGGDVSKSQNRRYYSILFARPRYLDGVVEVYGPNFILIKTVGPLVRGEHRGVYTSEADATKFLHCIGRTEIDKALAVPTRPRNR